MLSNNFFDIIIVYNTIVLNYHCFVIDDFKTLVIFMKKGKI